MIRLPRGKAAALVAAAVLTLTVLPGLVALALDPEAGFGLRPAARASTGRCPLCGFPTAELEPRPELLPVEVVDEIASEFPSWRAEQGICPQCADLYRARPMLAV